MREEGPKFSKFEEIAGMIGRGDSRVDLDFLKKARNSGEISLADFDTLASKLFERGEHVEEWLSKAAKKLDSKIEKLEIDPVTGLFKRAVFEEKLDALTRELNFDQRGDRRSPLCAIMVVAIDLDDLRSWNNDYSHPTGDKALWTLARSIEKGIREKDSAFRLGDKSDEIVVIVRIESDVSDGKLEEIFQHLKKTTNSGSINVNGGKILPVTAAMGYTVIKQGDSRSIAEILEGADLNQIADKSPEAKTSRKEQAREALEQN